jgi:hypothetical protein
MDREERSVKAMPKHLDGDHWRVMTRNGWLE